MKEFEWPEPDEGVQRALEHAKRDSSQLDIDECIADAEQNPSVNVDTVQARIRRLVRERLKGKL